MAHSNFFSITSGSLCFGALHNISYGAFSERLSGFPELGPPSQQGTILSTNLRYNIPALSGTWNVHKLVTDRKPVAFFVIHSSIASPEQEIRRIVRISGSPYEEDSGSSSNDDITRDAGIVVINRYDWHMNYSESNDNEEEIESGGLDVGIGMVDYSDAVGTLGMWRSQRSDERDLISNNGKGAWLSVPDAEYAFGRFAFNQEKTHATSFLFFTTNTEFTKTTFEGSPHTIRNAETSEERFVRRVMENHNFWSTRTSMDRPLALFGPYDRLEYIVSVEDAKDILSSLPALNETESAEYTRILDADSRIKTSLDRWFSEVVDLLNELLLAFVDRVFVSSRVDISTEKAYESGADAIFPTDPSLSDNWQLDLVQNLKQRFLDDEEGDLQDGRGLESRSVSDRLNSFLLMRGITAHPAALRGISRTFAFISKDLLYYSRENAFRANHFGHIMPDDLILAVSTDYGWYTDNLECSKVYWEGK